MPRNTAVPNRLPAPSEEKYRVQLADPYPNLKEWQRHYAGWLTGFDGVPLQSARLKQALLLAGYKVKAKELQNLEAREDFKQFLKGVVANDIASARKLAEEQAVTTMQQYFAMRDAAFQNGDYKEFVKYATPILDRVWAKSENAPKPTTQVVINLGGGGFAAKALQQGQEIVVEESDVLVLDTPGDTE